MGNSTIEFKKVKFVLNLKEWKTRADSFKEESKLPVSI